MRRDGLLTTARGAGNVSCVKATLLRNSYFMAKLPPHNIEDGNEMTVGGRSPGRHS